MQAVNSLAAFHDRLDEHFKQLRSSRDEHGGGKPIFALEHGLPAAEIAALQSEVRRVLRLGPPPRDAWLPVVVYAAEVGYRYAGDEYWQTFESETPGWVDHGDRHYVRERFVQFAKRYGGATPTGRWADHFSIICWPITHAVLPTDLQEDLAHLLYDYRYQLTAELIASPEELGKRLAARAYWTSARFLNFAQSTDLLGQVAAALLTGRDDGEALLLNLTLTRIVADLSKERLARRWLTEAKSRASHIALAGLARVDARPASVESRTSSRLGPMARPRLSLSWDPNQYWLVHADLPDFSVVPPDLADVHLAVSRLRCRVAGVGGPPLPRGALLYEARVTLNSWPDTGTAFLRLEGADASVNAVLADECCLEAGPCWVFKRPSADLATEISGKVVRPGFQYVVLSESELTGSAPSWIKRIRIKCTGVVAYELDLPLVPDSSEHEFLRSLGLGLRSEIEIRPVGLVSAGWDGEGRGEWIAGDPALIAISTTRDVVECVATLDGGPPLRIEWYAHPAQRGFVDLGRLDVGEHEVRVSILPSGLNAKPIDGLLTVAIREPRPRDAGGNFREAMVIQCSPAGPSLEELWDGKVRVQVIGPADLHATVTLRLERKQGSPLGSYHLNVSPLPIEWQSWSAALDDVRTGPAAKFYDESTAAVVEVFHPDLGTSRLRCSREFSALRWGVGQDRDGPYGRLYDNIGANDILIERLQFATPDVRHSVTVDLDSKLRDEGGGLFVATWREHRAAVVVPPRVRQLADFGRAIPKPWIVSGHRSPETVGRWLELSELWQSARLPGHALARIARDRVLRAFATSICSVIGGSGWAARERALIGADTPAKELSAWEAASHSLAENQYEAMVAADLKRSVPEAASLALDDRIQRFARHLKRIAPTMRPGFDHLWMATFLLRLVSSPGETRSWSGHLWQRAVEDALARPVIVRAARFFVVGVHLQLGGNAPSGCYAGWDWE